MCVSLFLKINTMCKGNCNCTTCQVNRNRVTVLQSKPVQEDAFDTYFDGAKKLENVNMAYINVQRVAGVDTYGINKKQHISDETFASAYLTIKVKNGSQEPIERLPLREIEKAGVLNGLGYPVNWSNIDYDSMRIISENATAHNADAGKVFELTIRFVKNEDSLGLQ